MLQIRVKTLARWVVFDCLQEKKIGSQSLELVIEKVWSSHSYAWYASGLTFCSGILHYIVKEYWKTGAIVPVIIKVFCESSKFKLGFTLKIVSNFEECKSLPGIHFRHFNQPSLFKFKLCFPRFFAYQKYYQCESVYCSAVVSSIDMNMPSNFNGGFSKFIC